MTAMDPMTTPLPDDACCPEFAALNRRSLLRGALALGGATFMGSATVSASASSPTSALSVLVVLSLRGGADGLSLAVPYGDPGYQAARPTDRDPASQLVEAPLMALFGLHPSSLRLQDMWTSGQAGRHPRHGAEPHPIAPTSPPWRRSRKQHPGSNARVGWLNRLVGDPMPTAPRCRASGIAPRHAAPPRSSGRCRR